MPPISSDETTQRDRHIVSVAVLYQDDKFLMQLRDDKPDIMYPGHWGFFGGHLEPGEEAEAGIRRELLEEIGFCPSVLNLFERREEAAVVRHVYAGLLEVDCQDLILGEGLDMALLTLEDIQRGDRYSGKIDQVRPLGEPHRQILLRFIKEFQNQPL